MKQPVFMVTLLINFQIRTQNKNYFIDTNTNRNSIHCDENKIITEKMTSLLKYSRKNTPEKAEKILHNIVHRTRQKQTNIRPEDKRFPLSPFYNLNNLEYLKIYHA